MVKSITYGSNIVSDKQQAVYSPNSSRVIPEFCLDNTGNQSNHLTDSAGKINEPANLQLDFLLPPIITHTAATPQSSPPNNAMNPLSFYLEKSNHKNENNYNINRSSLSMNTMLEAPLEANTKHHKSMVSKFGLDCYIFGHNFIMS